MTAKKRKYQKTNMRSRSGPVASFHRAGREGEPEGDGAARCGLGGSQERERRLDEGSGGRGLSWEDRLMRIELFTLCCFLDLPAVRIPLLGLKGKRLCTQALGVLDMEKSGCSG